MGNMFSGNYRFGAPPTVEDCWSLSTQDLQREGFTSVRESFYQGKIPVRDASTGQTIARIRANWVSLEGRQWLFVRFGIHKTADTVQHYQHPIPILFTTPQLGGRRAWFECPVLRSGQHCERRCARLYLPPDAFLFGCRQCYRLAYESAQSGKRRRLWLTARKIRLQLGGDVDLTKPFPLKPPHMQWRTYARLHDKAEQALARLKEVRNAGTNTSELLTRPARDPVAEDTPARKEPEAPPPPPVDDEETPEKNALLELLARGRTELGII